MGSIRTGVLLYAICWRLGSTGVFWWCVSLAGAFIWHLCLGAHSDELPLRCRSPEEVVWVQLSYGLSETLFCLLFSLSLGIGLSWTGLHEGVSVVQFGLGAFALWSAPCSAATAVSPGAGWMFDPDRRAVNFCLECLVLWWLEQESGVHVLVRRMTRAEKKEDAVRDRGPKVIFHSETLESSGSWAGLRHLIVQRYHSWLPEQMNSNWPKVATD